MSSFVNTFQSHISQGVSNIKSLLYRIYEILYNRYSNYINDPYFSPRKAILIAMGFTTVLYIGGSIVAYYTAKKLITSERKQTLLKHTKKATEFVTPYHLTLTQITKSDHYYYSKCMQICDKIKTINNTKSKTHNQSDHKNTWQSVKNNAVKCQNALYFCLQNLKNSVDKITQNKSTSNQIIAPCEVIKASLKKYKRSKEKVDLNYNGNWLRLVDVCRSCIVHENFEQLFYILLIISTNISNCYGFEIIRIKNRYQDDLTSQGWADCTLSIRPSNLMSDEKKNENASESQEMDILQYVENVKIDNSLLPLHICEVQLIHRAMWEKRKNSLFGHKAYKVMRELDAAAIKIGGKIGIAKEINEAMDYREKIVGSIGQTMFVRDDINESVIDITKNVVNQIGDETKVQMKKVAKKTVDESKKAMNKIGDGTKNAVNKIGDETKKVVHKIGDETMSVVNTIGDGTKKAVNKIGDVM
eukprot:73204_1